MNLLEFRVWNFKSIGGSGVTLNLRGSGGVLGISGFGKTNLIAALRYASSWIRGEMPYVVGDTVKSHANFRVLSEDGDSPPSEFDFLFELEDVRYRYGFKVGSKGVMAEWLWEYEGNRPRKLFERELDARSSRGASIYKVSAEMKGSKKVYQDMTTPVNLYLRVCAQFNHPLMGSVLVALSNCFRFVTTGGGSVVQEVTEKLYENGEFRDWALSVLSYVSDNLVHIRVSSLLSQDCFPFFSHRVGNKVGWIGFDDESSSFQRVYAALWDMYRVLVLKEGNCLVWDDTDCLPDAMLQHLFGLFFDKAPDSQIVCTFRGRIERFVGVTGVELLDSV